MMISAVDLLKGIGTGASMKVIQVQGANGGLNTNYEGKAMAAVHALLDDGFDFAYIHTHTGCLQYMVNLPLLACYIL